ncbi:hypothetical protein [Pseudolactococcus chungangensis]|jgi:hypothetical protein|uniref:hypothetical protein n=1 Tax=Pseudolactococcus chungangensis TaxID=451457 RepID=UPI0028D1AD8E|nr:hypothetical protein [Lactococcus chungangensis]
MEVIPDIKNSIGYINVNQALSDVFGTSVSLIKYEGIGKGEEDIEFRNDFRMVLKYRNINFVVWIGDTRTKGMMNSGNVGGRLTLLVPDFETSEGWSEYIYDDVRFESLEWKFPKKSKIWDFLTYEGHGNNLETIIQSLQILKNYLNEQIRLENEEKDRNSFGF